MSGGPKLGLVGHCDGRLLEVVIPIKRPRGSQELMDWDSGSDGRDTGANGPGSRVTAAIIGSYVDTDGASAMCRPRLRNYGL